MNVGPGASYEATFEGPTGLVGTLGRRVMDGQGATTIARSTTGIVETPAASGIYVGTQTAPSTASQYVLVWDTGGATPQFASEDLTVTSSIDSPWTGGPFVTRDDLGDYLKKDLSSDDAATIAVDAACDMVRTIAEQTFTEVDDETIVLDGTGTDALLLPQFPVIDVTAVTENSTTLTVDTDYKLNGNGVLYRMPTLWDAGWSTATVVRNWFPGRQNISVTYSHGYAAADLPKDVRMVALSIAARLFGQGPVAVFESLGAHSVRYGGASTDLTVGEKLILDKYRRRY